jgi:hypothetical protein
MDVRWNSTYLMLKHLLTYKEVFSVFINSNYGSELLTPQHWYVTEQIMVFLEIFYDCTAPLVLHHILEIAEHLQKAVAPAAAAAVLGLQLLVLDRRREQLAR